MKTLANALFVLAFAALVIGCSGDEPSGQANPPELAARPAVAGGGEIEPVVVASAPAEEILSDVDVAKPEGRAANALDKNGDTLFVATTDGFWMRVGTESRRLFTEPAVATLQFDDRRWVALDGRLVTADETAEIVPAFGAELTSLAALDGDLYVGTAGEGVFKLTGGMLEAVSSEMDVVALAATDFGLFAATGDGLLSYKDDRWHRRRAGDSSADLAMPTALFYRYPYLYVGTDRGLLRFDGGRWENFDLGLEVSALGWHNARLYIGTIDGGLMTLEGSLLETVASPQAGAVRAILRFDGRLHVATDVGLFRLRHGRFAKIDLLDPVESEPETEPVASLL